MAKGIALLLLGLSLLALATVTAEPATDWKKEKFTVIEENTQIAVAVSEPHQETKDIRSVDLLIVYADKGHDGTVAIIGRIAFNCTLSQVKYVWQYNLDENGNVLHEDKRGETASFEKVNPGTNAAVLFERVCGHDPARSMEAQI